MKRAIGVLLAFASMALTQSGIGVPTVGFIQDDTGALRRVSGLAGNFLVSDPLVSTVQSAAFSGQYGLIKTENRVIVLDQGGNPSCEIAAPGGDALFAFSTEEREAFVFFPATTEIIRIEPCRTHPVPLKGLDLAGETLSLVQLELSRLGIVVRRQETLWLLVVSLPAGALESELPLPGVSAPVVIRRDGTLLFSQGSELVVRKPDGTERRIATAAPVVRLSEMGEGWIHAVELAEDGVSGGHLALRLLEDREELYALPEGKP